MFVSCLRSCGSIYSDVLLELALEIADRFSDSSIIVDYSIMQLDNVTNHVALS